MGGIVTESSRRRSTAHHEAAHAITAASLGATLNTVFLADDSDSEGGAPVQWAEGPGPSRRRKIIQTAAAGPFGELKFLARSDWGEVRFDHTDPLEGVIGIIRSGELEDFISIPVRFVTHDRQSRPLVVTDWNAVGDFQRLYHLASEWDDAQLFDILDRTRRLLDRREAWDAVSHLAELLHRNGQVDGDGVVAVLKQFGLV